MKDLDYIIYITRQGDNLYKLAKQYNTTISAIKTLNKLKNDKLITNRELKIPVNYICVSKKII